MKRRFEAIRANRTHVMKIAFFCESIHANGREGANREKLTVKKLIDNEMFIFHRLCPLQTVKKSA